MFGITIIVDGIPTDYCVVPSTQRPTDPVLAYGFTLYGRRYVEFPHKG